MNFKCQIISNKHCLLQTIIKKDLIFKYESVSYISEYNYI